MILVLDFPMRPFAFLQYILRQCKSCTIEVLYLLGNGKIKMSAHPEIKLHMLGFSGLVLEWQNFE